MRKFTALGILAIAGVLTGAPAIAQDDIPPATIDTDGDGVADAWDRDGNGEPDAWDTNGDGRPDVYEEDKKPEIKG